MSSLNCPILSFNVRIWHFWSFLFKHDYRRYISIGPVSIMMVLMFSDLYRMLGNIDEAIINAYFAVLFLNTVLRPVSLVLKRDAYEKFLETISSVYVEIERIQDDYIQKQLREYTKRARDLSILNLVLGIFISFCFMAYPLVTGEHRLPFPLYIPGVDSFESPQYEIFFTYQVLMTIPGCCMYIPFTSFFTSATLFGMVQIKTLKHQLTGLGAGIGSRKEKKDNLQNQLKKLVSDHRRIITYVAELNSLVTYICLIEFLSFGLMLCALLFLLNIIDNQAQIIIVCANIFMIMSQLFGFYWHANELREESMDIAEAVYDITWIELDNDIKKQLQLIIVRAQQPLEITVGNVYPMTLEVFQSLLNASYSYFTLLRRVYK